jgi:hypothetical protein
MESLARDAEMCFAHPPEQRLVRLRVAFESEGRVFVEKAVQRVGELVLVTLRLRANGGRKNGLRRDERLDLEVGAARAEHVASRGVVELRDGRDVTGRDLRHRLLLLPAHECELVQSLFRHGPAVHERGVRFDGALQDLEQVHAAHVRVDDRLEHEGHRLTVARRWRGTLGGDEVSHAVDADRLRRAAAENREDRAGRHADRERTGEFGRVDRLVGEVALHEVVVGDDNPFDEGVVHRVLLGLHLGGDRAERASTAAVRVEQGTVVEQLDDTSEVGFLAHRQLERRHSGAELVLELVEGPRERRSLTVEFVHEEGTREAELVDQAPDDLGLHLDPFDGRHDEDHEVGRPQRRSDVAHEVGVAGCIEQVDLAALVLERCHAE